MLRRLRKPESTGQGGGRRELPNLLACLLTSIVFSACTPDRAAESGFSQTLEISLGEATVLQDDSARELAVPTLVSVDRAGRLIIADGSDRDIKIYDSTGFRLKTIGRPGQGPGEFMSLTAAQAYQDSIVASDFALRRLTVFSPDGVPVRSFSPSFHPFAIRVVDDSLFLLIRHPGQGGKLLSIIRPDGSTISEFFDGAEFFEDPQLRHLTAVNADAADGRVFVNIFGDDDLFIFNYEGKQIASGKIGGQLPLSDFPTLLKASNGRVQHVDGTWFHDGTRAVMKVVALESGRAALFAATYDTRVGTDPLEGGEILIVGETNRTVSTFATVPVPAGLMGRDNHGRPVLIGYSAPDGEVIVIQRMVLQ